MRTILDIFLICLRPFLHLTFFVPSSAQTVAEKNNPGWDWLRRDSNGHKNPPWGLASLGFFIFVSNNQNNRQVNPAISW